MMRVVALVSCLLMALAGCSSGPASDEATPSSVTTSSSATVLTFNAPPPLTDTLHLLDAPHLAATLPEGGEEIRVPIPSSAGVSGTEVRWSLPRPTGLNSISANLTFWVEVQGTVLNNEPTGCFWYVVLTVDTGDGLSSLADPMCASEPAVVPPGVRQLTLFNSGSFDISGASGATIKVEVSVSSSVAPGASVALLAGTSEHDSSVTIAGLQLPLDTQTLVL
jgi:hypothetical protein